MGAWSEEAWSACRRVKRILVKKLSNGRIRKSLLLIWACQREISRGRGFSEGVVKRGKVNYHGMSKGC